MKLITSKNLFIGFYSIEIAPASIWTELLDFNSFKLWYLSSIQFLKKCVKKNE